MKCVAYLETCKTKRNGKPFKNGKPRTYQVSTIHHATHEEAMKNGWHRCDGELTAKVETNTGGCPCCDPGTSIDITFKCNKCKFTGGLWVIDGDYHDEEAFIESVLNDKL
jgi:hypothetical protein